MRANHIEGGSALRADAGTSQFISVVAVNVYTLIIENLPASARTIVMASIEPNGTDEAGALPPTSQPQPRWCVLSDNSTRCQRHVSDASAGRAGRQRMGNNDNTRRWPRPDWQEDWNIHDGFINRPHHDRRRWGAQRHRALSDLNDRWPHDDPDVIAVLIHPKEDQEAAPVPIDLARVAENIRRDADRGAGAVASAPPPPTTPSSGSRDLAMMPMFDLDRDNER